MSYDIDVTVTEGERKRTLSMNWLRNPFGLCRWAEDNVGQPVESPSNLYFVCNEWSYDDSSDIDRELFWAVVSDYNDRVQGLSEGRFYFDLPEFVQFVAPKFGRLDMEPALGSARPEGREYHDSGTRLSLPMWQLNRCCFRLSPRKGDTMLAHYQAWFHELVEIAKHVRDGADVRITN